MSLNCTLLSFPGREREREGREREGRGREGGERERGRERGTEVHVVSQ